jgi:hypothetical protein
MRDRLKTGFADRQQAATAARQAQLEKFQPKPTVTDPLHAERPAMKKAELAAVREARAEVRQASQDAAAAAVVATAQAEADVAAAALEAKRGERKERKQLTKAEAKAKRDSRYAARKARQ